MRDGGIKTSLSYYSDVDTCCIALDSAGNVWGAYIPFSSILISLSYLLFVHLILSALWIDFVLLWLCNAISITSDFALFLISFSFTICINFCIMDIYTCCVYELLKVKWNIIRPKLIQLQTMDLQWTNCSLGDYCASYCGNWIWVIYWRLYLPSFADHKFSKQTYGRSQTIMKDFNVYS